MPKYQCPECKAVLQRENPVPEGKKIKCPKCDEIFKPKPMREAQEDPDKAKKKAKVAQKSKPADEDEEEGGSYGVVQEKEDTADEKKKKNVHYGTIRDKFKKSKRGPAMAKIVGVSNGMLLIGIVGALVSILVVMYGLWPFIFSEEIPRGGRMREKILIIVAAIFGFVCACSVCYGGSMFHDLRSYRWSMAAAIMCIVIGAGGLLTCVIVGIQMAGVAEEPIEYMLLLLGELVGAVAFLFSCTIGVKSLQHLKDDTMKEAFEETQEMKDY
jgi:hypothetical protein